MLVVWRLLQSFLSRTAMPPHAVSVPRIGRQALDPTDIERVMLIIGLFLTATLASWLAFLIYGYAPIDALFEVVSALGTVGLSSGITNGGLEWPLKALLCIDMLLGRLEILALLVLLYPRTWIGRRA